MDLAAFAHDLRTPLDVILGQMQLLRVEQLSDVANDRLDTIETAIRRISRLLEHCTEPDDPLADSALVDLGAIIRSAVAELDVMLQRRGIHVLLDVDASIPSIAGNGDALHRVLVNIIVNAAESMPREGTIVVRARPEWPHSVVVPAVKVEVTDTGTGIPSDAIPRVFEYGFTTKARGQGTGLGLWICREIVGMHGGQIELLSEPGKGTTVRVTLPTGV